MTHKILLAALLVSCGGTDEPTPNNTDTDAQVGTAPAITSVWTVEDLAGSNVSIVVDDEDSDDEEGRAAEEQLRAILEAEFSRMQSRMGQAPPSALYRRLDTESRGTMQGLFIGSFGPHGPEAVQLTRPDLFPEAVRNQGRRRHIEQLTRPDFFFPRRCS